MYFTTCYHSFLLHLKQVESFRKMEIIEMHNLEAPTGIEVIKRPFAKGLIEEFNDQEGKSAKRVKPIAKGKKKILISFRELDEGFS